MTLEGILRVFRAHVDHRQRALIRRLAKQPRRALPLLKTIASGDETPSVKRWAVEACGSMPERLAWPVVAKALRSPFMSVRLHALCAVGAFGNGRRANSLRRLLRDESGGIRINALSLLGHFRPSWLRHELKLALADEKLYVRRLAKRLLAGPLEKTSRT